MLRYKEPKLRTKEMKLPATRVEMFFDIYKNQLALMINLSLLCTLLALPLLANYIVMYLLLIGSLASENLVAQVYSIIFYFSLIAIPLYGLWYMGLNGAYLVLKKTVWNQGTVVRSTFFTGVKNLKAFLIGLFTGLLIFISLQGISLILIYGKSNIEKGVVIGACSLLTLLFINTSQFFLAGNNYYDLGFGSLLKNSFGFACTTFLKGIVVDIVLIGLPLAMFIIHPISSIIGLAMVVLIYQSSGGLIWTLIAHKTFDKYINSVHFPEYVNKGLSINKSKGE